MWTIWTHPLGPVSLSYYSVMMMKMSMHWVLVWTRLTTLVVAIPLFSPITRHPKCYVLATIKMKGTSYCFLKPMQQPLRNLSSLLVILHLLLPATTASPASIPYLSLMLSLSHSIFFFFLVFGQQLFFFICSLSLSLSVFGWRVCRKSQMGRVKNRWQRQGLEARDRLRRPKEVTPLQQDMQRWGKSSMNRLHVTLFLILSLQPNIYFVTRPVLFQLKYVMWFCKWKIYILYVIYYTVS